VRIATPKNDYVLNSENRQELGAVFPDLLSLMVWRALARQRVI